MTERQWRELGDGARLLLGYAEDMAEQARTARVDELELKRRNLSAASSGPEGRYNEAMLRAFELIKEGQDSNDDDKLRELRALLGR